MTRLRYPPQGGAPMITAPQGGAALGSHPAQGVVVVPPIDPIAPDAITSATLFQRFDLLDLGKVWQDSGKTTAVASNNDPVGAWEDYAAGGNDVIQATSDKRPSYLSAGLNGQPCIQGDGVNDILQSATFTGEAQPNHWFITFKIPSIGVHRFVGGGPSGGRHILQANGAWQAFAGSFLGGGTLDTDAHVMDVLFNGASSSVRIDGVEVASGDVGSDDLDQTTFFANATGTLPTATMIAASCVYTSEVDDADEYAGLIQWFKDRGGIS